MGLDPARITARMIEMIPRLVPEEWVQGEQTSKTNLASGEMFQVTPSKKKGDVEGPKEGDPA